MSHLCVTLILSTMGWLPVSMVFLSLVMLMFNPRDQRWSAILLTELGIIAFTAVVIFIVPMLLPTFTLKLDPYAFEFDKALFGSPSFYLGRLLKAHRSLELLASVCYGWMLVPIRVLFLFYFLRVSIASGYRMALAFLINNILCFPIYALIPVSGPVYAFGGFPYIIPNPSLHAIHLSVAPNGIPSVHMSTALLVAVFFWRWKAGRVFGIAWIALTILATLGLGEHYMIDLILAVPYTLGRLWLAGYELKASDRSVLDQGCNRRTPGVLADPQS